MSDTPVWYVGNRNPSITQTILNDDGTAHDLAGATVTFSMRPEGSSTPKVNAQPATVVSAPAGTVRYDWQAADVDTAGEYLVWWTVTVGGKTQDVPESLVVFQAHTVGASDLCTLTDVRVALEIPATDTSRDPLISSLITAASGAIMLECEREFAPVTASATRRFRIDSWVMSLAPYDLRTVSSFVLHPESSSPITLTAGTDYNLEPVTSKTGTYTSVQFSAYLASLPSSQTAFSFGYALCDITGAWGFASVPEDVQRACVITVASWLRKDVSALVGPELDLGGGIAPAFAPTMEIPHAAMALLSPYYRLGSFVSA